MKWSIKARLMRRIGRVVGKRIANSVNYDAEETEMEPLKLSTVAAKGGKGAAIGGIAAAVIGLLAGFGVLPFDKETQDALAKNITELITTSMVVLGLAHSIWNAVKNVGKVKDGVVVKCLAALVGVSFLVCSGCAITGPKGTWSIALNSEQIGVLRDVATQAANIAQQIKEQQAALSEAEKTGNTERAANILQKLAALREQFAAAKAKAQAKTENQATVVATAEATVAQAAP